MIYGIALYALGGLIGGIVGSVIARRNVGRQLAERRRDVLRLLRAEYQYWDAAATEAKAFNNNFQMCVGHGGSAAAANVIAALMGRPAPWHVHTPPKPEPEDCYVPCRNR